MNCPLCEDCAFAEKTDKVFHEIHVTVKTNRAEAFSKLCAAHDIKAVVIVDFRSDIELMTHVMTSQKLEGSDEDALKELTRIREILQDNDFEITREKIETNLNADRNYAEGYFESHLAFEVKDMFAFKKILARIGGLRISKNEHKTNMIMATARERNSNPSTFLDKMNFIQQRFYDYGYEAEKLIIEYCWLDTAEHLDEGWKVY